MRTTTDRIHVLHVDDEPDFADMTAQFLERNEGRFDVRTETSPEAGLALLDDVDIDCIVSDYDMPRTNGIEFLEALREERPDLPFILFTGKGTEEVASEAISAGVTEYLQKEAGTDQYTVLANRIRNSVASYRSQQRLDSRNRELQRYEQMINSIHEAAAIYDEDGRFEIVNQYLADWYETTPADLEGEQSALLPNIREQTDTDPVQELLDGKREFLSGKIEAEFPTHGFAVLEYRVTRLADGGNETKLVGIARDITDQQRQRRERRREAKRQQRILQHISDYVMIVDDSGTVSYVSPAIEGMLGYAPEDVIGTDAFDYVHPDDQEEALDRFAETIEHPGKVIRVEYRVTTNDGGYRWIEVSGSNHLDDPVIEGILVNVRDITERKELEAERETQIDWVTDAIVEVDSDWRVTLVNDNAEDRYGMAPEDVLGEKFWDVFAEVNGTESESAFREVMETREPTSFVEYSSQLDGWFESNVYPNEDGGLAVYFVEVTEQKQREQVLGDLHDVTREFMRASSPEEIASLAVEAGQGILGLPYTHFYELTDQGRKLAPIAATEEMFDQFGELPTFPQGEGLLWHALEAGDILQYDDVQAEDDLASNLPFRGAIIAPVGDYGVFGSASLEAAEFDTFDRELASVLITQMEAALDAVRRRESLHEHERELERQNERLEEFAGVVSHDLRNPLNVADGRVELAMNECECDHLEDIDGALTRMGQLIDRTLALARSGQEIDETEPVDLSRLIDLCWQNVDTANSTLRTETVPEIEADFGRLQQLFENLYRNAIEHGGEDVTVTIGALDSGFYIEDDGNGIPEDEREDVFDTGYSTNEGGTGFGLSIVKQIVEAHNWDISVTEGSEGGARFEITGITYAGV